MQQQIALINQDKLARTPEQKKLSSSLIFAARIDQNRPAVSGVPSLQAPSLQRDMVGRVLVDIKGNITTGLAQTIAGMGGTVVGAYPQWNAMRAWIGTGWLDQLALSPDVRIIRPADKPVRNAGSVESEGDTAHGSKFVRNTYGAGGGNSKIGVISDSADFRAASIASGDLPSTLQVLIDDPGQSGEGTAMMEIIHDVAPDAALAFATGFLGEAQMAQAVLDLAAAGCDIIVDDLGYLFESPFQDGVIAQAVEQVVAQGKLYFSAAGNQRGGVWEGDFRDGGAATGALAGLGRVHRFPNNNLFNTTSVPSRIILGWSDPTLASANDYDLYILNSTGTAVVSSSDNFQTGTQDPIEFAVAQSGQRVVIVKFSGQDRALRLYGPDGAVFAASTTGETYGHSGAAGGFGVAAVDANLAFPSTFSLSLGGLVTESFSSTGPRRIFYNANGTAITPNNFLFATNGGVVRNKPDFTAADGVKTTFPGSSGLNPFFGTSAAAPHAAALMAQMKSLDTLVITPTSFSSVDGSLLSRSELIGAFTNTALDIEALGWDGRAGVGILSADRAADKLVNFVSNLVVTPGMDQVTFTWKTSLPAASTVWVGLDENDPNAITVDDPSLTTDHSVTITGLTLDLTYQYQVDSSTQSGAVYNAVVGEFTTIFIDNVSVTGIGANQVTISWRTAVPATSKVVLSDGPSDPNPIVVTDSNLVINHSVTVTPIREETDYDYTLSSETLPAPDGFRGSRSGKFKTLELQEVIPITAVLLSRSATTWQLAVTLKNRSLFSSATNVKIDSVIFSANNTTTVLPFTMPSISANGTVTQIFRFNKLRTLGTVVRARVTGSYTTPRRTNKRFSGELIATIRP
ncbi:S8 family serine peptidase [Armatimonas sp.]|uniref:S8 family serine peptidase n=1 Tax=Armatimonas sp. TaxID=1872638 RepID=UPI00286B66C7|nr:S8 family serine peptidase [Armatimonas sp.]